MINVQIRRAIRSNLLLWIVFMEQRKMLRFGLSFLRQKSLAKRKYRTYRMWKGLPPVKGEWVYICTYLCIYYVLIYVGRSEARSNGAHMSNKNHWELVLPTEFSFPGNWWRHPYRPLTSSIVKFRDSLGSFLNYHFRFLYHDTNLYYSCK